MAFVQIAWAIMEIRQIICSIRTQRQTTCAITTKTPIIYVVKSLRCKNLLKYLGFKGTK